MKGLWFRNKNLIGKMMILLLTMFSMVGSNMADIAYAHSVAGGSTNEQVELVTAEVTSDGHIPDGVCQRMEKSIQAIGTQLLEGKSLENIQSQRSHYEDIIQQVFDKVLVGYTVKSVNIQPREELNISVSLLGWNDKIDAVTVEKRVVGMPDVVEKLLLEDISDMDQLFTDMLQGLSVAAVDWTNGVMKHRVKDFMNEMAPEFRADFDVEVGENTKVIVDIYPLLPVVRTIDLSMRSDTLPNAALLTERQNMQDGADMFVGVPVAFVKRHKDTIEELLAKRIDDLEVAKFWGIHTQVDIKPAERMEVMSRSDSSNVYVRFEGWGELGHRKDSGDNGEIMFRGIFAKQFTTRDGAFALVDFYPKNTRWYFDLGLYRELLPKVKANVRYSLRDKYWKGGIEYNFAKRLTFRYEYRNQGNISEFALRYKLHDFLALEAVMDNDDKWLRFIGYF